MLNTLYIDTTNSCECTLVSSVDDKTARLKLNITSDIAVNPQLEIVGGRTVDLYKSEMTVFFTDAEIQGTGTLQFRIVDDHHTGDYFNIKQCSVLDSTLYIKQIDNFNYELSYKSSSGGGTVDAYTKAETNALLAGKSDSGHNHNGTYATPAELDTAKNEVLQLANEYADTVGNGKAELNHNHDERYYTESEINNLLSGKSDTSHTHDGRYYTETEVNNLLAAKQATITGGATTIASSNLTANRALISNSSGKVAVSAVTSTELGYLDGVTSAIQTQLNGKAASSHNHDSRYYTETEVNNLLAGKSATGHTHDDRYYTESEINSTVPSIKTSGNKRSYRFPSGLQIETNIVTFTNISCTTLWGANFYESSALNLGSWLQAFSEAPVISVSVIYGSGYNGGVVECLTAATTTSAGSAYIIVPNSTTGRNFKLQVTGVGRWK